MEVRLSRVNPHLPMVLPVVVPLVMILLGETMLFVGNLEASIIVHLLNIMICVMTPILLKENPIIWQAFSLVSMLRILNLGMPKFASMTLYWIPMVYAPVILVAFLLIRDESFGARDYLRDLKKFFSTFSKAPGWKSYYLPIALVFSLLLANIEFKILSLTISDLRMIPDLSLGNLVLLFVVMVFFVGLGEELIFRYVLQARLVGVLGAPMAIIVASLAFAAMHSGYQSIIYMVYVLMVAVILGVIFHKTKSLAFVTLIHGSLNFFLFSLLPFGHLVLF